MRTLGDYTLTRRLGVGGMGEVWMGRREALGGAARDVAIKLLSSERASNVEARRMFLDEARLSMLLRNSNIVQVHDVAETDDKTCYMVMEFVEGLNLSELSDKLRKSGEVMPDSIIAFIIGEVLKGLAHAHELRDAGERKTVVHRDVSPHNVMISIFGEVKIMDFGIARVASEDTSGAHVKGKLRYMPPEQLRGETREPTLDLFAVGAMLHELLDGVKFRSKVVDETRLFGMILDAEIPEFTRAPDSIPKELDELRLLLLAPKPTDRIQSAREAFRRLTAWSGYRDTRFELDELVRRHVGRDEPHPAIAGTAVLSPPVDEPLAKPAPPSVAPAGILAVAVPPPAEPLLPAMAAATVEATATALLAADGSDTDISRIHGSGTDTAVASRTAAPASESRNKSKLVSAGLAVFGLCFVGIGASAMAGLWSKDAEPAQASVEAPDLAEVQGTNEALEQEEPPANRLDLGSPDLPSEPVAVEQVGETGATVEPVQEDDDEPLVEPEQPEPVEDEAPQQAVAKTKVSISLGAGVAWAEVKLGGRTYELDAFSGKGASTRLKPGSYSVSCRMQVNGAWKQAGRVTIPDARANLVLGKNCVVSLQ